MNRLLDRPDSDIGSRHRRQRRADNHWRVWCEGKADKRESGDLEQIAGKAEKAERANKPFLRQILESQDRAKDGGQNADKDIAGTDEETAHIIDPPRKTGRRGRGRHPHQKRQQHEPGDDQLQPGR